LAAPRQPGADGKTRADKDRAIAFGEMLNQFTGNVHCFLHLLQWLKPKQKPIQVE